MIWRWSRRRWVAYLALLAMLLSLHHAADAFLKPFPGAMNHEIEALMLARLSRMGIAADSAAGQATLAGLSSAGVDLAIGAGALLVAGTPIGWGGMLLAAAITAAGTYYLADANKVPVVKNSNGTSTPPADFHNKFPPLEQFSNITPNPCWTVNQGLFGTPGLCGSTELAVGHAVAQWATKLSNSGVAPRFGSQPAGGYGGFYLCGRTRVCSVFYPTTEYFDFAMDLDGFRHTTHTCDDGIAMFNSEPGHEFDDCSPLDADAFLAPDEKPVAVPDYLLPGVLSPSVLDEPVAPWVLAKLLNKLWADASSKTGYAGVPYTATDPISVADADALKVASPTQWPTVRDLTSQLGPNTVAGQQNMTVPIAGTAPGTVTAPGGGTAPATGVPPVVKVDYGAVPTVAEPTLPETTIDKIIDPLFSFFPSVKAMRLDFSAGVCPRPGFDVWEHHYVFEYHCTMLENYRAMIGTLFLALWTISAAIILLKA